jgi:hypothetical protein
MTKANWAFNAFTLLLAGAFSNAVLLPLLAPGLLGTAEGWLFTGVATLIVWGVLIVLLRLKLRHSGSEA